MNDETDKNKRKIIQRRRNLIQQHIIQATKRNGKDKVVAVAKSIKDKGLFNRAAYWEFMKTMRRKRVIKGAAVNDEEGKRIDDPEKIKDRYQQYFKNLLTVREAINKDEKMVEDTVDRCIEAMEELAQQIEIAPVTDEEHETMKKSLKKEKATDAEGWMYEMIIYAGKDLEESIKTMINAVLKTKTLPEEWSIMDILPIDKSNGYLDMDLKRGLFLTNIISKCVEKILFKRREKLMMENLSPYTCGGVLKRAIQDNLFVVNHTIYRYKKEGKNLYMLFADIEKCFDNLWLKDCILELVRCGTPIQEAIFIYHMNKKVRAKVNTPVGDTDRMELKEIVRQGTVGGSKLCIVSTDRINKMGHYLEKDGIRYPIFIDDKLGLGEPDTIREMVSKMRILEVTKKYIYNIKQGKTEWMMIRNNNKTEDDEELELEVNRGKIGRATQYKYMGDKYNEKGTNESKIAHKAEKLDLMIINVIRESSEKNIGKAALLVRIMLIEVTIAPTILGNTETWHNITKQEQQAITKTHHKVLTKTLYLPKTTPYMGIISELDIWPFVEIVWYKKLMWYHRLIHSDNSRIAKVKLLDQMEQQDGWYAELKEYADINNIVLDVNDVIDMSYETYKTHIQQQIQKKIHNDLWLEKEKKTKLRWINPGKRQQYINECSIAEASAFLKIRLHMRKVLANYGGGKCRRCGLQEETTEHVLNCQTCGIGMYEEGRAEDTNWLRKVRTIFEQFEEENSNIDS